MRIEVIEQEGLALKLKERVLKLEFHSLAKLHTFAVLCNYALIGQYS